jgi:hypothetical protein
MWLNPNILGCDWLAQAHLHGMAGKSWFSGYE